MATVNIKSVRIEGFRSYTSPVRFNFGQAGLYHIMGVNGMGKTSIFSALCWGLFKINLNNTNNDEVQSYKHLRGRDYKGTRVIVELAAGKHSYLIARHLNYKGTTVGLEGDSSLMILVKGLEDKSKWSDKHMLAKELYKGGQQDFINKLLGIGDKIFVNSIVFGQRMARLVKADGVEKRKLFEEFFDLGWIDLAKDKASKKVDLLKLELDSLSTKVVTIEDKVRGLKVQIEEKNELIDHFESDKKDRLRTIKAEYESEKANYSSYKSKKATLEIQLAKKKVEDRVSLPDLLNAVNHTEGLYKAAQGALIEYNKQIRIATGQINTIEKELVALGVEYRGIKDKCAFCGQSISKKEVESVRKGINKRIDLKKEELTKVQLQRIKFADLLAPKEKEIEELAESYNIAYDAYQNAKEAAEGDSSHTQLQVITSKIQISKDALARIKERYEREKVKEPPKIDVTPLQGELVKLDEELKSIHLLQQEKAKELEHTKFWADKGFSSKGLKAHIFSAMLQQLNQYTKQYGVYFGYNIEFSIDLSKASKPFVTRIFNGENELNYDSLSGGQQQRVDVCLAFAMNDLINYKTQFNLMVLDEVQEGLDAEGVAMLSMLIQKKSEEKAIYLITHNDSFVPLHATKYSISGGLTGKSVIE